MTVEVLWPGPSGVADTGVEGRIGAGVSGTAVGTPADVGRLKQEGSEVEICSV